jgi:hypothetical protein
MSMISFVELVIFASIVAAYLCLRVRPERLAPDSHFDYFAQFGEITVGRNLFSRFLDKFFWNFSVGIFFLDF